MNDLSKRLAERFSLAKGAIKDNSKNINEKAKGTAKLTMSRFRAVLLAVAIIYAAAACFGTATLSKYASELQRTGVVNANDFSFSSDYLKESGAPEYTVYGTSASIKVRSDDGLGVPATANISYKIEAEDGTITEPGGAEVNGASEHLLVNGAAVTDYTDEYTVTGTIGSTVTVTAISVLPYERTISAKFTFVDPGDSSYYTLVDNGHFCTLKIYTGSGFTGNTIAIDIGDKFSPDITDARMESWSGGSNTLTGIVANAYYELNFFEKTAGDYSAPNTKFTEATITLPNA